MAIERSCNWRLIHLGHTSVQRALNATIQIAKKDSPSNAGKTFGVIKELFTTRLAPLSVPTRGVMKQKIERIIFRSIFADAIKKQ